MPTTKHRISISLDEGEYQQLAATSQRSRVSMAWIARDALIEYLARHKTSLDPTRRRRISPVHQAEPDSTSQR